MIKSFIGKQSKLMLVASLSILAGDLKSRRFIISNGLQESETNYISSYTFLKQIEIKFSLDGVLGFCSFGGFVLP